MGPSTAIGEFFVPPLHILLNKVGQLSVAMAGERVLSTGYSLSRKKSMNGFTVYITYKPTAKRIAQAFCDYFLFFFFLYIFVFPFLLIRDLVHETGDFM